MTTEKQYKETVVDLETLGDGSDAHIVSIGAVKFNLEDNDTYEELDLNFDRTFYEKISLHIFNGGISAGTLQWWFAQSDEARAVFKKSDTQVDISKALAYFNRFTENRNVWGNGNMFDNVILRSAYKKWQMAPTWNFRQDLDMRTLRYIALAKVPDLELDSLRELGTHHNARNDAIVQVLMMQRCWRAINGELNDSERRSRTLSSIG